MGAKKGNTNALKHGLYARHYNETKRTRLDEMPPLDSLNEIFMLRSTLDDILSLIEKCEDDDRKVKLYNSLFVGAQRLTNAMRTHTLLVGDNQELLVSFWDAIEAFRKEHEL